MHVDFRVRRVSSSIICFKLHGFLQHSSIDILPFSTVFSYYVNTIFYVIASIFCMLYPCTCDSYFLSLFPDSLTVLLYDYHFLLQLS